MRQDFDIRGRLNEYFPIFFELLGDNRLDWNTITKVFTKKVQQWITKFEATGQNVRVEASFYNIITASRTGDSNAASHLDFIRKLFEELTNRLDHQEKVFIVPALYGMLTNVNKMFRNFLGELLVLNNIKANSKFKLVAVEVPVMINEPKGAKIDFKFFNPERSTNLLVEIVNVHLIESAEWSDEMINRLLHQKLQGKLNITGIDKNNEFNLIPVFWGSFEELRRINRFYVEKMPRFKNTTPPTAFSSFTKYDGSTVHVFGTISSIIDLYNQSNKEIPS